MVLLLLIMLSPLECHDDVAETRMFSDVAGVNTVTEQM